MLLVKEQVGYGDSEEFCQSRGGAPPPLDPIDPAVVGSVPLGALWQSASDRNLSLLTESIGVLLDDRKSLLRQSVLDSAPVEPSRCGVVGKDYIDHFSTLERSGLVRQQKQGIRFLLGISGYRRVISRARSLTVRGSSIEVKFTFNSENLCLF
jgi:hypothetical protein